MDTTPSKTYCGDRDLRKGAISSEAMAAIIRKLEEAKISERQRAARQNSPKTILFPQASGTTPPKAGPKTEPQGDQSGSYPGLPPPAPTRPTFMFFME